MTCFFHRTESTVCDSFHGGSRSGGDYGWTEDLLRRSCWDVHVFLCLKYALPSETWSHNGVSAKVNKFK